MIKEISYYLQDFLSAKRVHLEFVTMSHVSRIHQANSDLKDTENSLILELEKAAIKKRANNLSDLINLSPVHIIKDFEVKTDSCILFSPVTNHPIKKHTIMLKDSDIIDGQTVFAWFKSSADSPNYNILMSQKFIWMTCPKYKVKFERQGNDFVFSKGEMR